MKNLLKKPSNIPSPFNRLPDELILHILNKVTDLKSLCLCKAACRRFSSIVHEVDTVSFAAPPGFSRPFKPYVEDGSVESKYFCSAFTSLKKMFSNSLKSLCIELSPGGLTEGDNNGHLFKWKIKSSNKFGSYVFLSANSVVNNKGVLLYQVELKRSEYYEIARKCLRDAVAQDNMLANVIKDFPSLEKVNVKDSSKRRTYTVRGGELTKMKNLLHLGSPLEVNNYRISLLCYARILDLPVSGYVMKDVAFFVFDRRLGPGKNHSSLSFDDEDVEFDDEDEPAYIMEAVMKIFKERFLI